MRVSAAWLPWEGVRGGAAARGATNAAPSGGTTHNHAVSGAEEGEFIASM